MLQRCAHCLHPQCRTAALGTGAEQSRQRLLSAHARRAGREYRPRHPLLPGGARSAYTRRRADRLGAAAKQSWRCYLGRIRGERAENQERALGHFQAAQEVYTRAAFPLDWALARRNEGRVYVQRATGDRRANFDQALACYQDVLSVYTRDAQPREWSSTQSLFGNVYQDQVRAGLAADPSAASERAVACYSAALEVRSLGASPLEFRRVSIQLAEAEAQRGRWDAAHAAYEECPGSRGVVADAGGGRART